MTDGRTDSAGPAPAHALEHWRDARLNRALDFAPDQLHVPAERTRIAIKNIAKQSVSEAIPAPARRVRQGWRQRLWPASSGARMPWNAALATVLLAGFVTLLWRGEPVPDVRPDRDTAAPMAERDARAAGSVAESAAQPAVTPEAARDAASVAAPAGAKPRVAAPPAVPTLPRGAASSATPSPAVDPTPRTDRPSPPPATAQPSEPAPFAEPSRAREATPAAPDAAPGPAGATAADAAPPPLAKAAPALSAAARRPAPAAAAMAGRGQIADADARLALDQWTQARIVQGGRTFSVTREEAPVLAALLSDAVPDRQSAGQGAEDPPTVFGTRIELLREGQLMVVVELAPPWVRYTVRPVPAARAPAGRANPSALAELQAEMARLQALPR